MGSEKIQAAIIGSGNIGTDLMFKIMKNSQHLSVGAMIGIDPASDGLARAQRLGVPISAEGIDGLLALPHFKDIKIVFDATSAKSHLVHNEKLQPFGIKVIDLTPAAIGPYVVPSINLEQESDASNINMVTCGGQATIPIVNAVAQVTDVYYAEIVASIASKSAGPGTRANIDEFTETTSAAIVNVGKARAGKAIIILNPATPPIMMRDTVFVFSAQVEPEKIAASVKSMVHKVSQYVPGYRLKQDVQFDIIDEDNPLVIEGGKFTSGLKTSVFIEVEGAAHYLPAYAGNLDIMTSAALACADHFAKNLIN